MRGHRLSRRQLLKAAAAFEGALAVGGPGRLIDRALAQPAAGDSLDAIDHIVILMQENRSFDSYFGTLSGVRGFSDPAVLTQMFRGQRSPVWHQYGYRPGHGPDADAWLEPFELFSDPPSRDGQTTNDITHDWRPQHESWNSGHMDLFLRTHLAYDGPANGFLTMGYFTRKDLPFYHALADAFTICDGYHCSVLGPTDPNRVFWMSASLGADGSKGPPVLATYSDPLAHYGSLSWETMPERLSAGGVSWKVYQDPTSQLLFNVLPFFKAYAEPSSPTEVEVANLGLDPQFPEEFQADVAAGTLPAVSWIMPPAACCEHPAAPPAYGEWLVATILDTLVGNPDVWARTVFLVVYDENGGFFDHVPPSTPGVVATSAHQIPSSDSLAGEYVTATPLPSDAQGIYGPVGFGFRTPCLVVSPFSRGGWVCSDTFDSTSTMRLIERRFGVEVPNLSPWRRSVTGDLTSALPLLERPDRSVPTLPATSLADPGVAEQAVVNAFLGTEDAGQDYPPPSANAMPRQETGPARRRAG